MYFLPTTADKQLIFHTIFAVVPDVYFEPFAVWSFPQVLDRKSGDVTSIKGGGPTD